MFLHANPVSGAGDCVTATISPGHFVSRLRRVSAKPTILTPRRQSVGRGRRRDGCMGALGRPARSLPPWCQTNHLAVGPPSVSSAVSVRCNVACEMEAVQKWPISRLFLASCPDEVARATADRLGDRHSLTPILFRWPDEVSRPPGAPLSVPVSAVCGRRSEREQSTVRGGCGSEWSGRKVPSPASDAAEPCRYLARREPRWRAERKCRLGDACGVCRTGHHAENYKGDRE
jgi:hypothetical protein